MNIALMKARRERLRLRQVDVATALGVDRSTVASWETGRASPEARLILPLAELLKVTANELLAEPENDSKVVAG